MNVLILGSGGREHAIAWKISQSNKVNNVFVAPGNAGTALESGLENVAIGIDDISSQIEFAKSNNIALTIVGPEGPLVNGVVDQFTAAGLDCFGPSKNAAQLEGSKTFAKDFLLRHSIPTAEYESFTEVGPAISFLEKLGVPCVIKADGLAAGKGVIIVDSLKEGRAAITDMLADNRYGVAGSRVVVEEFLEGEEASFICMVDGSNVLTMATSQDHKAAYDGDAGPNTGGMGAYSPAPVIDQALNLKIMQTVIMPTVSGMAKDGIPYSGFLYAGLMIDGNGIPKVLEFNCRFGDPETQPIMMRLQSDLVEHCIAAIQGRLDGERAVWDSRPALGVVLAAEGYPGSYRSGDVIYGMQDVTEQDVKVFHAGTGNKNGELVTSGGRVLCVTAIGDDVSLAQAKAYETVNSISWEGKWCRTDIGYRAIDR